MNGGRLDDPLLHPTRGDFLSRAVGNNAVGHHTLDQPVTFTTARGAIINTLWAQIVVSMLTDAAVIMFVGNGATTVVAVDAEHPTRGVVRDDGEAKLVLLHLEVPVARLTDG